MIITQYYTHHIINIINIIAEILNVVDVHLSIQEQAPQKEISRASSASSTRAFGDAPKKEGLQSASQKLSC